MIGNNYNVANTMQHQKLLDVRVYNYLYIANYKDAITYNIGNQTKSRSLLKYSISCFRDKTTAE